MLCNQEVEITFENNPLKNKNPSLDLKETLNFIVGIRKTLIILILKILIIWLNYALEYGRKNRLLRDVRKNHNI